MRIILKSQDQKALDINLHLNDPSKTNQVYKQLRNLKSHLGVDRHADYDRDAQSISLPDDAKIDRHNLDDMEEIENIRKLMKSASRDDLFVAFSHDDSIMATITDYFVRYKNDRWTRETHDNVARVLRNAEYILHIHPSDIDRNDEMIRQRKINKEGSTQIEREKFIAGQSEKFKKEWRTFERLIEKLKKRAYERASKNPMDLEKGERIYYSGEPYIFSHIDTSGNYGKDLYAFRVYSDGRTSDQPERLYRIWSDSDVETDRIDGDYPNDVFEINWARFMAAGHDFPTTLIREWTNSWSRDVVYAYESAQSAYNNRRRHHESDYARKQKTAQTSQNRAIKDKNYAIQNSYHAKDLVYRDRSGYIVNLAKYFTQLAEIRKGVPKIVIDKIKEIQTLLETNMKSAATKIKELASNEEFEEMNNPLRAITSVNQKWFDMHYGHLKLDGTYDMNKEYYSGVVSEGKALELLESAKQKIVNAYSTFN